MNLGQMKEAGIIIQYVDRSNAYLKGILEDFLVQVNELVFSANFYILGIEDESLANHTLILLGRPFFEIAQTKIDAQD